MIDGYNIVYFVIYESVDPRDKERPPTLFCFDQAMCLPSRAGEYVRSYVLKCQSKQ